MTGSGGLDEHDRGGSSVRAGRCRPVERLWPLEVVRAVYGQPAWTSEAELLDQPGHRPDELRGNLDDIARVNRFLGGYRPIHRAVRRLLSHEPRQRVRLLDVGTGGADIPGHLRAILPGQGELFAVGVDVQTEVLRLIPEDGSSVDARVTADARQLPFGDCTFHVTICSMVLHHLAPADALAVLCELKRVSRDGVVVNDLIRGWHGYFGALLMSQATTRNRLTRNDAPLSIRRAYTRQQLARLVCSAGMEIMAEEDFLGLRRTLTCRQRV